MWLDNYNSSGVEPEHPEEALAAFSLNALDNAEFQAVFHHVVQCLHCQEVLVGFQDVSARLTGAAPESPLPPGLKNRVLAKAVGREAPAALPLPGADARWSLPRLRRWLAPAAIGALSLLLAVSVGVMAMQQQEIGQLSAAYESLEDRSVALAAAYTTPEDVQAAAIADAESGAAGVSANSAYPSAAAMSPASAIGAAGSAQGGAAYRNVGGATDSETAAISAEAVDRVKQEMAEMVEATVLSAQPETEKVAMVSPMGTEPQAKGVLVVEPNGRRGVLMVSGMPADSYQIWLMRGGHKVLVDRIVVNDDDGTGVKQLELDESIFRYNQVALMPDQRHGPTAPTGEQFLTALIMPMPAR